MNKTEQTMRAKLAARGFATFTGKRAFDAIERMERDGNLGRSIAGRFGGKDGAIPWYRRIFTELRLTRRQHSDFGIAEQRTLKEIERKTGVAEGGGKGGLFGLLGGGMSKLLGGMGGGIMRLFVGGGGLLKLLGRGALGLGKLGLRRLPLLGALFAGGSALASMFGPGDPNKSDEENRKDRFTGAGSGIGALLGGGIGMLLGGPVGAVVGGVLGDKVGELVGAWLATVDWSKVADTITGAWKSTVGFFKDSWKTVTDKLGEISKTVTTSYRKLISVAEMSASLDDMVVKYGKECLQLPMDIAIKRMTAFLKFMLTAMRASNWLVASDDPVLGDAGWTFTVTRNAQRPADRMDVNYGTHYDGVNRATYVQQTLSQ